jgi:alkane 1-monooxygenase
VRNKGYKHPFVYENKMIWYTLNNFILPIIIFKIYGFYGMIYFVSIGCLGAIYLEIINYLEHYGLQRKKLENGQYENVNITHSWNSPHRFSNYLLFKLQRHSDHHENSLKPYQSLCSYDDSPTLPNGYPICLLLATFTNLWFSIMNPMVISYNKGEKLPEIKKKEIQNSLMRFIYYVNFVLMVMVSIQFYFII